MLKTNNYLLNKPENTDTVDISKLNENMDTIDTKIKEIENKTDNIKVPVQSVNGKTGSVVLSSTDIKCVDGVTVEKTLEGKADTFNKSDSILNDSNTIATSKAVYNSYSLATTADRKATDALGLINKKQDYTVITEKLPTDLPSSYPLGYSTFYTSQEGWRSSCNLNGAFYAVVETCHAKLNYGITQKITWFYGSNAIISIFERASFSSGMWGSWMRILDNITQITDLKTNNKTVIGAINEIFEMVKKLQ